MSIETRAHGPADLARRVDGRTQQMHPRSQYEIARHALPKIVKFVPVGPHVGSRSRHRILLAFGFVACRARMQTLAHVGMAIENSDRGRRCRKCAIAGDQRQENSSGDFHSECARASGIALYTASRNALCKGTLPNGRYWVNRTAVILFLGSTQKSVSAAPSQKNSPTAPDASFASAGGRMRTAKSMPKPTWPLLGSQEVSLTSAGIASVAINCTVSGLRMRLPSSSPPFCSMRAKRM